MEQHRISMTDLVIGKPLPWDVSDAAGHLLLSRGHIIERPQQIEALMERGMYVDAKAMRDGPAPRCPEKTRGRRGVAWSGNPTVQFLPVWFGRRERQCRRPRRLAR